MNTTKQTNSNYQWIRRFVGFLAIAIIFSTAMVADAQQPTPTPRTFNRAYDFDGDGKADPTIIRFEGSGAVKTQTWYVRKSSNGQMLAQQWGINNTSSQFGADQTAPGDYDGDGKADFTAVRSVGENYVWYILHSNGSGYRAVTFGLSNYRDKIAPGDYDGDGKSDIAVLRSQLSNPNYNVYYILLSGSNNQLLVKSIPRDFPVVDHSTPGFCGVLSTRGDYDGDGKTDFIQLCTNNGVNYYYAITYNATNTTERIYWGVNEAGFAPGDYDGDGKTDLAHARLEGDKRIWYIRRSSDQVTQVFQWGGEAANNYADAPVAADYDGDGKADAAVWRYSYVPSNPAGVFYIRKPDNTMTAISWGTSTANYSDFPYAYFYF